jgi:mannose/cellobiose epimerase-like protein (N-acyl-D-glucosamine 2-epimerase family)
MLDLDWFRSHLLDDLLPCWLRACKTQTGLFLPNLDRQWNPMPCEGGTLISQGRLLFNFAAGYRLTGREEYLSAVRAGARFLVEHFRDPEYGGCYWSCAPDGSALESRKDAYGHAFAIFGLAYAFGATGDTTFRDAARDVWAVMKAQFTDRYGGLIPHFTRDFRNPSDSRSQNPVMHSFEALLALAKQAKRRDALKEAERVAAFILSLTRPEDGALPEVYTEDWRPLPVQEGGRIDVGHQFEWAWLLSRGVEMGLPSSFLAHAERLLEAGLRLGYDAENGGIFSPASYDGALMSRAKGWWEQCEAARALLHFTFARGREDLREPLEKTVSFFQKRLIDREYGGWYMCVKPDGAVPNTEKGNVWKVDYHVVGMCLEAIRLAAIL